MKPTVEDIKGIRPGKTKTFLCKDVRECISTKSLLCYVRDMGMPEGVARYTYNIDREQNLINITAVPATEASK